MKQRTHTLMRCAVSELWVLMSVIFEGMVRVRGMDGNDVNVCETHLKDILRGIIAFNGVNAAAVVTKDGTMVTFVHKQLKELPSSLPYIVAVLARTAEKCVRMFDIGEMRQTITKADEGIIFVEKIDNFVLVVSVERNFDMKLIEERMKEVRKTLRRMI